MLWSVGASRVTTMFAISSACKLWPSKAGRKQSPLSDVNFNPISVGGNVLPLLLMLLSVADTEMLIIHVRHTTEIKREQCL